jgi:hypothetical protein
MGHPTGRIHHTSWANRRRPISEILPGVMDQPMSAQNYFIEVSTEYEDRPDRTVDNGVDVFE